MPSRGTSLCSQGDVLVGKLHRDQNEVGAKPVLQLGVKMGSGLGSEARF